MTKKSGLFVVFSLLVCSPLFSQEPLKIGHVNFAEIEKQLPETDSVQSMLNKEADELEKMYSELLTEHEKNVQKYEDEKNTYSEFIRKTKESELMESAGKIQQFQQTASQNLQKRNVELLQPVYQKINEAIATVANRNNFTYILDLSSGAVVFNSANSQNINPLVLKELKVDE